MQLVTHQTGPEGQKVRRLYIEDGADIKNELYVSWSPTAHAEGGPDRFQRRRHGHRRSPTPPREDHHRDRSTRCPARRSRPKIATIGLTGHPVDQAVTCSPSLYKCYMDTDASLVEINPLNCDSRAT